MSALIIALTVAVFMFGILILALSSNYLVTAVIKASKILGIPLFIVGTFLLALVNTLPEMTNNIIAGLKGVTEMGVGNLIGAAFIDLTLVIGLVHLISEPHKLKKENKNWTLLLLLIPVAVFLLAGMDGYIGRAEGFLFFGAYGLFQYMMLKTGSMTLPEWITARRLIIPYLMIPLAVASIVLGAFLVVDTGGALAMLAGLPAATIGMTLISIGTVLPEAISAVIGAIKKDETIGIGSAVGCMITDLGLIIGLIAMIFTIHIDYSKFWMPALMLATMITFYYVYTEVRKETDRLLGFILMFAFVAYITLSFMLA